MSKKDMKEFTNSVHEFMIQQTELNETFLNLFKKLHSTIFNSEELDIVVKKMEDSKLHIDDILDKINDMGYDSLTEDEKNKLQNG